MEHPEQRDQRPGEVLPEAVGDCYEVSFHAMFGEFLLVPEARLVHAVCLIGVGSHKDLPFGHAWIEVKTVVSIPEGLKIPEGLPRSIEMVECVDLSNGRDIRIPNFLYYQGGRPTQIHRYTRNEAVEKAHESGHSGPWDLESEH